MGSGVTTRRKSRKSTPSVKVGLADALLTRTQQRVLALLFGQPDRTFTQTEIITLASSGSGAVQRELGRLVASGVVTSTAHGRQKQYRANDAAPIFDALRQIVDKTIGIPTQVSAALAPITARMNLAILFGSVARGTDVAASDIDVLVVSDELALERLFAALAPAEKQLGRKINATLYTTSEFLRRRRERQPFLTGVLDGKHVVLFGSEDAVEAARKPRARRSAQS